MPTHVSTGSLTIADLNDGLYALLSSETGLVHCNSAGTPTTPLTTAPLTTMMTVYKGNSVQTGFSFARTASSGVTSNVNASGVLSVTGLTVDDGWVDITASKAGEPSITKRYVISKVKQGVQGIQGIQGPQGIQGVTGQTGAQGPQGTPSIMGLLTNDSHVVPTDSAGNNGNFNGCNTTVKIFVGTSDDSANWSVTATPTNVTGTLSGKTYTVTSLSADVGYVDFSATRSGYTTIPLRFTITRSKQGTTGATGSTGATGASATAYWLVSSVAAIKKSIAGAYTPTAITFSAKSQTGTSSPVNYAGRFRIYESANGSTWTLKYTSSANEVSKAYTPSAGIVAINCELYLAGGVTTLIDQEIVPIVSDGATGPKGDQGPQGLIGPQGNVGPVGQGIDSITEEYAISTSKTTAPSSGWSGTAPTWSTGKYLWTRSKIIYKNPTDTKYTTPFCDNAWEAVNEINWEGRNLVIRFDEIENYYITLDGSLTSSTDHATMNSLIPTTPGTVYTFQKTASTVSDGGYWRWRWFDENQVYISRAPNSSNEFQWIVPSGAYYFQVSYPMDCYPKIEKGAIATDWTPAPEDLEGIVDKSVKTSDVQYYLSTSSTALSGGSWQTTAPQWVDGKFMWTRTKTTLNDGTVSYSPSSGGTCIAGAKGATGPKGDTGAKGATGDIGPRGIEGTSITGVTEYYLATTASSGVTTGTAGWATTLQPMTATKKYLWNYEKIHFSEGADQPTIPVIIGVYGDKGVTGDTGRAITSIQEKYLVSPNATGIARVGNTWYDTPPATTTTNKYLWNYEIINWSTGTTPTYVEPFVIGVHGATGPSGTSITSVDVEYAISTSNTTAPETGWTTASPAWEDGKFMWSRVKTSYSVGDPTYTNPACITGAAGPKGDTGERGPKGDTGVGVSHIVEHYLATNASSGVTTATSGWTESIQTPTPTNKYLWNYEEIFFDDETSQPTIPVIIGVYGEKGETGDTGRSIESITEYYLASSASSGVTRSTSGWKTTMQKTTPTNKYLWNYEKITWDKAPLETFVDPIIIGIHGDKGDTGTSAKDFSIISSSPTYLLSSRGITKDPQVITLTCSLMNISEAEVSVDWSVVGSATLTSETGVTTTLYIGPLTAVESVTIACSVSGYMVKTLTINGIRSGDTTPIYLGVRESAPVNTISATPEGPLFYSSEKGGDYYLGTDMIPYWFNGSTFQSEDLGSLANYADIMSNCVADALNDSRTIPVSSAIYGYFQNLVATDAFIENLGTKEITLKEDGSIASSYDDNGATKRYERGTIDTPDLPADFGGFYLGADGYMELVRVRARDGVYSGVLDSSDSDGTLLYTQKYELGRQVPVSPKTHYLASEISPIFPNKASKEVSINGGSYVHAFKPSTVTGGTSLGFDVGTLDNSRTVALPQIKGSSRVVLYNSTSYISKVEYSKNGGTFTAMSWLTGVSVSQGDDIRIRQTYNNPDAFVALGQGTRAWSGMTTLGNDVYAGVANGDIYKQTNGTGDFVALGQTSRLWYGMTTLGNDVYVCVYNGDIYKQTNGTGNFVALGQASRYWYGMTTLGNDVYASVLNGDIYKQTNGTGNFVALGQVSMYWYGMTTLGNDVYACASGRDIYKQTNGTGNFVALGQTPQRLWYGMTTLGNDVYACVYNGDIYKQTNGTGDFVALGQASRYWYGMTTLGNDVYACVLTGDIYKQTYNPTHQSTISIALPNTEALVLARTNASTANGTYDDFTGEFITFDTVTSQSEKSVVIKNGGTTVFNSSLNLCRTFKSVYDNLESVGTYPLDDTQSTFNGTQVGYVVKSQNQLTFLTLSKAVIATIGSTTYTKTDAILYLLGQTRGVKTATLLPETGASIGTAQNPYSDGYFENINGNPPLLTKSLNGYPGIVHSDGTDSNYLRTPVSGLIPYASGGSGSLGTSYWPFNNGYFKNLNVTGAASVATINTGGLGNFLIGQNLRTTDSPTFASVDTGFGANEVYKISEQTVAFGAVGAGTSKTMSISAMAIKEIRMVNTTGSIARNTTDTNYLYLKLPAGGTYFVVGEMHTLTSGTVLSGGTTVSQINSSSDRIITFNVALIIRRIP